MIKLKVYTDSLYFICMFYARIYFKLKGVAIIMKNKIVRVLALCLVGGIVLTGCNASNVEEAKISSKGVKAIREAMASTGTINDYIIQDYYQAPDGEKSYLEVVTDGSSYMEMPVDKGTSEDGSETNAGETSYMLVDWLDKSGDYYMILSDAEGNPQEYSIPSEYGKKIESRKFGYLDKMLDNFTSVEEVVKEKGNIGEGEEEFTTYKCTLPAKNVREILGLETEGLYKFYAEAKDTDKNVKKLLEYYLDELDMALTFSDAVVSISVADGKLRQMTMEIGGLGSKMYITKTFILNGDFEAREKPDFSDSKEFTDSLKDVADFVAKYDSYEEALEAMSGTTNELEDNSEATQESSDEAK